MRISDWSSDVCSSDLSDDRRRQIGVDHHLHRLDAIAAPPWSTGRSSFAEPRDAAFSLDLDDQECLRADLCLGELVCPADRQIDDRGFDGADAQGVLCQVSRSNDRSEEHTSELQSLMRITYAV